MSTQKITSKPKKKHKNKKTGQPCPKKKKKKGQGQATSKWKIKGRLGNVQEIKKRKKKVLKKMNVDETQVQLHMSIFVKKWCIISLFSFLSILERKIFDGFREKTPKPHHLFSFLPTKPNILKKVFIPIFSPKFSIHHILPPNKHTLRPYPISWCPCPCPLLQFYLSLLPLFSHSIFLIE